MDPLAEVLRDLRLASSFYAQSELRAPWGLSFSTQDGPSFHAIISGRCWLRLDAERTPLATGDLVVLPRAVAHQLGDTPEGPTVPLAALPSERIGESAALLRFDGGGEPALLICGGVRFAGPIAHPLVEILPRVLLLRNTEQIPVNDWQDTTLAMLGKEALSLRPGTAAIMTRLADILVLQTIRAWLERDLDQQLGWLGALRDPEIGQALVLIHREAEKPWTVASLAAQLHLSRSVFSERFNRRVGTSPMRYVARWRMYLASSWMREDGMRPGEIAYRLGYSSEAAFSRAFKHHLRVPPGVVWRDANT